MSIRNIFLAGIEIEALTPFSIGSGEWNSITDSIVSRDANNLPYIPGTAIAGIIRHQIGENLITSKIMGENSNGSKLIVSSAHLVIDNKKVADFLDHEYRHDSYLSNFYALPIRQNVKIDEFGTATKGGKFDQEIVFRGTRFYFELELQHFDNDKIDISDFEIIIKAITNNSIRIGAGSRKGFGEYKVNSIDSVILNLENDKHLNLYLEKSSSLNNHNWWKLIKESLIEDINAQLFLRDIRWREYKFKLKPENFFLFSSGFGTDYTDISPLKESYILWDETSKPALIEHNCIVIPATSIKGAISHRLAYNYNKLNNIFSDKIEDDQIENYIGEKNPAVKAVFGCSGDGGKVSAEIGKVQISDIMIENDKFSEKILNHVKIDSFTGGAISGALFNESVVYMEEAFNLTIRINEDIFKNEEIRPALEKTLEEFGNGLIPLGGGTNRGLGFFNIELVN